MTADGALTLSAPAKLNLMLRVLGRRADGYHELVTVLQTLDLCDTLELRLRPRRPEVPAGAPDVTLTLERPASGVPDTAENLAVRAALAVLTRAGAAGETGLHLALGKRIPAGGGLAGGSSDAAAALRGTNELLGHPLEAAELAALAAALGSDVPFFLVGGTALCTGRGEIVEPIAPPASFTATLLMPPFSVPTAAVYSAWALATPRPAPPPDLPTLRSALDGADAEALQRVFINDLQPAARAVEPRLAQLLDTTRLNLAGSGSTLFGYGRRATELTTTRQSALICWTASRPGNR